jgi:hypothetical protein
MQSLTRPDSSLSRGSSSRDTILLAGHEKTFLGCQNSSRDDDLGVGKWMYVLETGYDNFIGSEDIFEFDLVRA